MTQHLKHGGEAPESPNGTAIMAGLDRILADSAFQASTRRREMLRYIVSEAVAGRADRLKGMCIAQSVFERGDDFDPQSDAVVRIEARRLRRDLDSYYAGEGRDEPVRIAIPKGAYVPSFTVQAAEPDPPPAQPPEDAVIDELAPAPTNHASPVGRWGGIAAGVVAALVVLLVVLWPAKDPAGIKASAEAEVAVRDAPPGLIVLPFQPLGASPDDHFLAEGITHELITNLMKFEGFRLFSVPTAFARQGAAPATTLIGNPGIDYMVEGSVRSNDSDGTVWLSVRMMSADTGLVIWSDTITPQRSARSLIETQLALAAQLAERLGAPYGVIGEDVRRRLIGKVIPDDTGYGCVMRAYAYRRTFDKTQHGPVSACLDQALAGNPTYAEGWAMRAWLHIDAARYGYGTDSPAAVSYQLGEAAADRALALDDSNVAALKAKSAIRHHLNDYAAGERFARRALALNPNDPDTLAQLGWRIAVRGKLGEGVDHAKAAISRTVGTPPWYFGILAIDDLLNERWDDMLTHARAFSDSDLPIAGALLAIAEANAGNGDKAAGVLADLKQERRFAEGPETMFRTYGMTDDMVGRLMGELRQAGWEGQPRL